MAKIKTKNNSEALVQLVVNALHEKKGNAIVSLDLRKIKDTVANFFIVAHGDSSTHVNALHQTVVEFARQAGQPPYRSEGTGNAEWVIVDFIDVVVHIFHRDKRDFYQLEDLWHDAPSTKHGTEELKNGRGNVAAPRTSTGSVTKPSASKARPEIDGKEYKDKVTLAKLKQKALREQTKTPKKPASKASAKTAAKKSAPKKASKASSTITKKTTTKKAK